MAMSALVRCPQCDTFVKPASIDTGSCPFCPSQDARSMRNPIPGLVLAATMAAVPACSSDTEPQPGPVYGIAVDASTTDASPVYGIAIDASGPDAQAGIDGAVYGIAADASTSDASETDAAPIYGVAPESE